MEVICGEIMPGSSIFHKTVKTVVPDREADVSSPLHGNGQGNRGSWNGLRPALVAATAFAILELVIAERTGMPMVPFAVCIGFFLVAIAYVGRKRGPRAEIAGRILALTLLLKVFAVCVAVTGGAFSPYTGILYLPVFLGALYFGLRGGASMGIALALFFLLPIAFGKSSLLNQEGYYEGYYTQSVVFLLVSTATGYFTQRLQMTAEEAGVRAREQETRAREYEWFTDTAVMMQSLYDLEHMLSAALLRLDELMPCDSAAIFLRDADDPQMSLSQTIGIRNEEVGLRTLSLNEQALLLHEEFTGLLVPNLSASGGARTLGAFGRFDPKAAGAIVVPLRTLDDLFGVIYVGSYTANRLGERERELLVQFARHVVYPIQRVRLQAMATTDALTGLSNRRAFRRRLRDEVERARRYRHLLSFVILDIDFFKRANDTFGHRAGDAILAQMGGILRRVCRGIDFPARYGGEEMVILCPETGVAEALVLAERLRSAVEENHFELPDGGVARLTISIGVATLPIHAVEGTFLTEAADRALFAAKSGGRNRVCVATPLEETSSEITSTEPGSGA